MGEIVNFPPKKTDDKISKGEPEEPDQIAAASGTARVPTVQQAQGFAVPYSNIPVVISLADGGVVPAGQVYKSFATAKEAEEFSEQVHKIMGFIILSSYARPREGKDAEFIDGGRMQAMLIEQMLKMGNQ
jgi:hypothetical protein